MVDKLGCDIGNDLWEELWYETINNVDHLVWWQIVPKGVDNILRHEVEHELELTN